MKTNKITVVPKLRFPEFRDNEGWREKTLNDICHFVRGPFGGALKKDIFVEDGYAVYEQAHAIYGNFDSFRYFITQEKFDELKRFEVKADDLIMSCSGTMGKFSRIPKNPEKGVINQALLKLTVRKGYSTSFIKNALELPLNQSKLLSQSAGGAVKNVVGVSLIKQITIAVPKADEQKKIADCLSSLDNLIQAENEQLDALKEYKAGLLQQLFPAEGEMTPKFRFAEFKDDGDWELMELESCLDYLQPTKYIVKNTDYNDKYLTPVLTAGKTFILGYTNEKTGIFSEQIPVIIFDDFTTASKFVDFPFKVKSSAMKILLAKDSFDIKFLYESIQNLDYEVGVHKRHWISVFSKIKIAVPNSKEQHKIANCLSSLDSLIQAKDSQVDMLKTHKQGLMQQLFPVMEAE